MACIHNGGITAAILSHLYEELTRNNSPTPDIGGEFSVKSGFNYIGCMGMYGEYKCRVWAERGNF